MNWISTCRDLRKEEVSAKLENGYLTISAAKGLDKDKQDEKETIFAENVMQAL